MIKVIKKDVIHIDRLEVFEDLIANKRLTTFYQPIVSLHNGDIIGYEALMRGPEDSFLRSPVALIEIAKEYDRIFELEMISREKAILGAKEINPNMYLFLNIEPNIIKDSHYKMGYTKELLELSGLCEHNIVFEITERTAITDYLQYIELLDNYKKQGYKIAIDDVGSGYSGLSRINDTKPEYIKIDMDLIRDINKDSFKQSLITAMVKFATMTGMRTIAEGIETKEELETIIRLGVHYGQGYFIAKPQAQIIKDVKIIKKHILNTVYDRDKLSAYDINTCKIGAIAETTQAVHPYELCCSVKEHMSKKGKEGIAIINEFNEPIGLLMKNDLDARMATQYGFSIYSKRSVYLVMDHYPIIVDYNTPIKRVSEIVTLRDGDKVYDNVIIIQNNKYYGIVSVRNLLQQITNIETNYARHLNPLTLLPGNKIINSMIAKNISLNKKVAICYLDLDYFKIFNDTYGFEMGDKVIKMTAKIIEKYVQNYFPLESFIGHIGGDDFVFIIQDKFELLESVLEQLLNEFDNTITDYYSVNSCDNNIQPFIVTSISIGIFIGGLQNFSSVDKFSEHIVLIKKAAKNINGSSYIAFGENNQIIARYARKNKDLYIEEIELDNVEIKNFCISNNLN